LGPPVSNGTTGVDTRPGRREERFAARVPAVRRREPHAPALDFRGSSATRQDRCPPPPTPGRRAADPASIVGADAVWGSIRIRTDDAPPTSSSVGGHPNR